MLFWCNSQFVEECMMPDSFHIIPVVDNTILDWVFQVEDTSLGLGFITNISFFAVHTNHYAWILGSSNNCWEATSWSIITSNTSFALTWSVIDNNCSLFVTHLYMIIYVNFLDLLYEFLERNQDSDEFYFIVDIIILGFRN